MTDSRIAVIIGRCDAKAVGPLIFEELAASAGLKCLPERGAGKPFTLLARTAFDYLRKRRFGALQAVFFLCAADGDPEIPQIIRRLRTARPHAKIIVYEDSRHDSGARAIEWVHDVRGPGVSDYFLRKTASPDRIRVPLMKHLLIDLVPIRSCLKPRVQPAGSNRVFVATPYHELAKGDCYDGIVPGVRAAGLDCLISDEEVTSSSILEKIQGQIDGSGMVIVNLTQYDGPRMNVYIELGYALSRRAHVILIARMGTAKLPSNIAGLHLNEYSGRSDLALQLYFGLK